MARPARRLWPKRRRETPPRSSNSTPCWQNRWWLFSDKDLTGNWQCRTIKAGGPLPLVIYGWFKCKVTDDGSGWRLEKISGSQRTKGRFFDDGEKRAIYLGSAYVNNDTAKPYGSGPQSDQVGYAFRNSASEWRIEFPAPYYELKLDILEFKR